MLAQEAFGYYNTSSSKKELMISMREEEDELGGGQVVNFATEEVNGGSYEVPPSAFNVDAQEKILVQPQPA